MFTAAPYKLELILQLNFLLLLFRAAAAADKSTSSHCQEHNCSAVVISAVVSIVSVMLVKIEL